MMCKMGLYKAKGIVLKSMKLGEADKIVTLISSGRGKIRAVAKGIRKTKSKFGSRLEPFTYIDMLVYEGRNLDIITQVEIITSFKEIRSDLEKLKYGSVMLELVDHVGQEKEESEDVFALLLAALKSLRDSTENLQLLVGAFELKLMSATGYHPQVEACVSCGRREVGRTVFSFRYGGILCQECRRRDEEGVLISEEGWNLIRGALSTNTARLGDLVSSPRAQEELFRLAQLGVSYYLERELKSPRLLKL
jgi:DNA repair protein RecO (recombination protein O)